MTPFEFPNCNEGSSNNTSLKLSLQIIWIKNEMAQNCFCARFQKLENNLMQLFSIIDQTLTIILANSWCDICVM